MRDIGFFIFSGMHGKEVVAFGDDPDTNVSAQDAASLALVYLTERISAFFETAGERMRETQEAVQQIAEKLDALDDRLSLIESAMREVAIDVSSASSSLDKLEGIVGLWGIDDLKGAIEETGEQVTHAIQAAVSDVQSTLSD